jgi:hypothetical protein
MIYKTYRSFIDWLHGYPKNGLDFYYQHTVNYTYHSDKVVTRIPDLKWYSRKRAEGKAFKLCVGGVYNKKLLPVVDADCERDMLVASAWLDENHVNHAILTSSPDGFWIIIDRPGKWRDIKHWVRCAPGQDVNYVKFSDSRRMCYIRAEMKDDYFVPSMIKESGSETIDEFCESLIKHYESSLVLWLYRHNLYKNGDINLADPSIKNIGLTFDEILA